MIRALGLAAIVAAGCNQLLDTSELHRGPCAADAPFVNVARLAGVAGVLDGQSAQLSRDELTIMFSRVVVAGISGAPVARHGDLYVAYRARVTDPFGEPVALDELNTDADERDASLSSDQRTVYFARQGPRQRYQIYAAERAAPGQPYSPASLVLAGEGDTSVFEPYATTGALYFASRRNDGAASLFVAVEHDGSLAAQPLASLEILPGPTAYESPVVSPDGLTIYFAASPDTASPTNIWRASRASPELPFDPPRPVTELDSLSLDRPNWISDDSCRLYFTSNRTGDGLGLWLASRIQP